MIEISQKNKGILILLGVCAVMLILVLSLALGQTGSADDSGKETFVQTIPDGQSTDVEGSKSEAFRRSSNTEQMWSSLEELQSSSENISSGAKPEVPDVEQLFGPKSSSDAPAGAKAKGGGTSRSTSPATGKTTGKKAATGTDQPAQKGSSPAPSRVKRSGAISSLDEDVVETLGNGFSSLDEGDRFIEKDEGHPYKCMFTRSEKVKSGQRISVRLLEDLMICGEMIPQNTHLSAVCNISSRMNVTISSIEFRGKILSFKLEAYDTDGGKGIYCTDIGSGRKTVTDQGISTVTSSLSSHLGRVANDAANVGASIIRSKTGEITVEIPAGYVFYVIESKEK